MVTKKDFKTIAEIIAKLHPAKCKTGDFNNGENFALKNVAICLAGYFAGQNPHFDRQKFLDACGL